MVRGSFYQRLSGFYFCYFAFIGAFAPYFALYLKSLGYSAAQIGLLLAVNPVARIFGPNLWGWLSDHYRARGQLIRITAVGTAIVFVAVFFNRGFGWMFTALLFLNVFWCGVLPLAESATLSLVGARVGAYGRVRLWGSVGFVAVVIVGGYVLDFSGVGALAPMVLILLVLMAASTFFLPRDREPPHHAEHASILSIVRRPEVIALLAGFFLMQIAHGPYNAFYSIHLVEAGYSKKAVGWLWSLGVIAEIGLFMLLPRLMRAYSLNQILLFSFGCAFVRLLLIAWGVGSLTILLAAQLLHAVTFGAFHSAGVAMMHQIFRGRNQARGQAIYTSLGYGLGGTLGTLMAGYAWETLGAGWTFTFAATAALLALVVVAWRPISLPVRPGS
ncbi:MAG TPA: MFS transporter [Burkholderiales bacterium]|nr:MFS transporter [Burkholderiales bacterium]